MCIPTKLFYFMGTKNYKLCLGLVLKSLAGINYRHIIDSLIRKPAAFANYQYHEALFPRLCFRKAYDALRDSTPANAEKQYLKLLQLAKLHSEEEVAEALELLLEERQLPTPDVVKSLIDIYAKERQQVYIHQPNVAEYDCLLSSTYGKETH